MNDIKMLVDMLELQQRLNDETNGLNWESGYTKDGKLISFKRCIYVECVELIDSFPWKHWKCVNSTTNWENVRIEIVDIWHFMLSLLIERYKSKDIEDKKIIANDINSIDVFKEFCKGESVPNECDVYGILNDIEFIIHKCSGFRFELDELLSAYFILALKCGLNLNTLYKIYIGKNVLNKFRQDNGYKEGIYKKVWNDKEDNEILNEILNEYLEFNLIYKKLDDIYKSLK